MLKTRVLLPFALLILVFATFALGDTEDPELADPELKQCKHQCRAQQGFGEGQKKECTQMCDWYQKVKQMRDRDKEGGGQQGGGSSERYPGGAEQQEEQGQEGESPYVFQEHHFTTKLETQHGRFRILPKFTQRSKLLRGIENFRLAILEAEPRTFVIPNHWDAENICFVIQGDGTVSLAWENRRESFNVRQGDIVRVPSGTTVYLINRHNNQKLILAQLLRAVSNRGEIEAFFPAGSQDPESYFRAFSPDILKAALNTRMEQLQTVISGFGKQRFGAIKEASEEQIKALSQHGEGGIWPFGGGRKGTINIFEQTPSQSNEFGRLQEVEIKDFRELEDVNVELSYANITQGGILGPLHNSKTTLLSVVVDGIGEWQMSCPHLASQQQGSQQGQEKGGGSQQQGQSTGSRRYEKVSARLRPGVVFIVPADHPYVIVASNDQNLEVVSFKINALGNKRFPLAGKKNVIKQLERVAKELAFGVPARIVDEVFGNQEEEYFFKGPRHGQHEEGRADA